MATKENDLDRMVTIEEFMSEHPDIAVQGWDCYESLKQDLWDIVTVTMSHPDDEQFDGLKEGLHQIFKKYRIDDSKSDLLSQAIPS